MADIKLVFDPQTFTFDIALDGADLAVDDGLETPVIVSLFSDRRADDSDPLPDDPSPTGRSSGDRRGYWGDWYPDSVLATAAAGIAVLPTPTDRIGSRDWLLSREKQTPDVLQRAIAYGKEALQWMIDDGIAASVDIAASFIAQGLLRRVVTITRPDGTAPSYTFDTLWAATAAELG
jgi:phage gp46-like protein